MFSAFSLVMIINNMHLMSTALIVILSIVAVGLFVFEGIICGKITSEIVHKKDDELNEVLWFWLGFLMSWLAIVLTLVVKNNNGKKE